MKDEWDDAIGLTRCLPTADQGGGKPRAESMSEAEPSERDESERHCRHRPRQGTWLVLSRVYVSSPELSIEPAGADYIKDIITLSGYK